MNILSLAASAAMAVALATSADATVLYLFDATQSGSTTILEHFYLSGPVDPNGFQTITPGYTGGTVNYEGVNYAITGASNFRGADDRFAEDGLRFDAFGQSIIAGGISFNLFRIGTQNYIANSTGINGILPPEPSDVLGYTQAGAVPEPATWAMMLIGLAGIGGVVRSRRNLVGAVA